MRRVAALALVLGYTGKTARATCLENPLCTYCNIPSLVMSKQIEQTLFFSFERPSFIANSDLLSDYGFSGSREFCKTFCCASTKTSEATTSCRDCNESPIGLMNEHLTICQFNQLCTDCASGHSSSEVSTRRRYLTQSTAIFASRDTEREAAAASSASAHGHATQSRRLSAWDGCPDGAECVGCGINGTVTNECDITCPSGSCNGARVECPDSGDCTIKCVGANSCRETMFVCPSPLGCAVECLGDTACYASAVESAGDLNLKCEGEDGEYYTSACHSMEVSCPNTKTFVRTCDGRKDSPLATPLDKNDEPARRLQERSQPHRRLLGALEEPSELVVTFAHRQL
jgi:hypothetical protein